MEIVIILSGIIGAYVLGSISSAIVVCFLFRLPDPRSHGSQNPGATNVLRIGGKLPAILTLLGDLAKGFIPVMVIRLFTSDPVTISLVLLAAVIGHIYPLFFGFKGGKGVATAVGGLWGSSWLLGAFFVVVWLSIFVITRFSSLSALIAIIGVPIFAWFFLDPRYVPGLIVLALIIIWRHRENIVRLFKGTEMRSTFKKPAV